MSSHPWGAIFSGVKVILFLSLRVFFLEITYFVISLLDSTIPKFIVDENEVIFTVRNSSCGKVMFLHLFASASRGCTLPYSDTPHPKTATAADGTYSTGMHSCLYSGLCSFDTAVLTGRSLYYGGDWEWIRTEFGGIYSRSDEKTITRTSVWLQVSLHKGPQWLAIEINPVQFV